MVASRRSGWQSRAIAIEHTFHSERIEDAAVQEVEHRHPAKTLHDYAGGDVVRVAYCHFVSGSKSSGFCAQPFKISSGEPGFIIEGMT